MKRQLGFGLAIIVLGLMPTIVQAQSAYDLSNMLTSLTQSFPGVLSLIGGFAYTMGVFFVLSSIYKFKAYAQGMSQMSADKSIVKPLITFFIGVGFLYLPGIIDTLLYTLWNYGSDSLVSYTDTGSTMPWANLIGPLTQLVELFGLISIVRGWMLLAKLGSEGHQGGTTGKAMIHIIGGICAWNIVGLWSVIQATLGIS
jgi:hypothetical protein